MLNGSRIHRQYYAAQHLISRKSIKRRPTRNHGVTSIRQPWTTDPNNIMMIMMIMAPSTTTISTRRFATTSSRRRPTKATTTTKREDQRRERKRARAEKRHALLQRELTRTEHIAKFGIWDREGAGILWLGLFPLLAMGLCLAYMPGFYDELFHEHVEKNKALPTRPISLPFGGGGGGGGNKKKNNSNKSPTEQESNDNNVGEETTNTMSSDGAEQSQAAASPEQ